MKGGVYRMLTIDLPFKYGKPQCNQEVKISLCELNI